MTRVSFSCSITTILLRTFTEVGAAVQGTPAAQTLPRRRLVGRPVVLVGAETPWPAKAAVAHTIAETVQASGSPRGSHGTVAVGDTPEAGRHRPRPGPRPPPRSPGRVATFEIGRGTRLAIVAARLVGHATVAEEVGPHPKVPPSPVDEEVPPPTPFRLEPFGLALALAALGAAALSRRPDILKGPAVALGRDDGRDLLTGHVLATGEAVDGVSRAAHLAGHALAGVLVFRLRREGGLDPPGRRPPVTRLLAVAPVVEDGAVGQGVVAFPIPLPRPADGSPRLFVAL